jgi:hypothetical protein
MRFKNRTAVRVGLATVAAGALAAGALTLVTSAGASPSGAAAAQAMGMHAAASHPGYGFRTADNAADLTFNQLLGINNDGLIAGYFGSGAQGHPNMGYVLGPGGYRSENFPGSVQTQVTGLNNTGVTVGFWSNTNMGVGKDANFGFYATADGGFHSVNFPTSDNASPQTNQLLGVNDRDVAVGFYADGLTPGAHAAHIHVGSCQSQGPVQYMQMDFTANGDGQINGEVRTLTCPEGPPGPAPGSAIPEFPPVPQRIAQKPAD